MNPAERLRTWRARKRAKEICQACGRAPVHKRTMHGQTFCFTKCKRCLRRAAWYQAEYLERLYQKSS